MRGYDGRRYNIFVLKLQNRCKGLAVMNNDYTLNY